MVGLRLYSHQTKGSALTVSVARHRQHLYFLVLSKVSMLFCVFHDTHLTEGSSGRLDTGKCQMTGGTLFKSFNAKPFEINKKNLVNITNVYTIGTAAPSNLLLGLSKVTEFFSTYMAIF